MERLLAGQRNMKTNHVRMEAKMLAEIKANNEKS
jgi:hypothetical protein